MKQRSCTLTVVPAAPLEKEQVELSMVAEIPPWREISARLQEAGWNRIWWVAVGAAVEPSVELREAARDCNMSLARLNRTLNGVIGMTFHQLRMRVRLSLALELLCQGGVSVHSAAGASGFDSVRRLERWCHRLLGCSLREWQLEAQTAQTLDALAQLGEPLEVAAAGAKRAAG